MYRYLFLVLLFIFEIKGIASQAAPTCLSTISAGSLLEAYTLLDQLHRIGYMKDASELTHFLDLLSGLDPAQKKVISKKIISEMKSAERSPKAANVDYPEFRALQHALGVTSNPLDLWNAEKPLPARIFLENFLRSRGAPYNLQEIDVALQLLQQTVKEKNCTAYIIGSLPNGFAIPGKSDIDVLWKSNIDTHFPLEDRDVSALNRKLHQVMNQFYFSHGTYEESESKFFVGVSKVVIEVQKEGAYLLLYPASYRKTIMGVVTEDAPTRIPLH